jgi:hypothetical protein
MQVITANRLSDGRVVYLDAAGGWTTVLDAARLHAGDAVAAGLATAVAAAARQEVVDPYAVAVAERPGECRGERPGAWVPTSLRERIRAFGPTTVAGR